MVLLSVGVLALAGATQVSMRVVNTENLRNASLQLARSYLEQVRGRDPDLIVTEAATRIDETGTVNPAGRFTRSLTVSAMTDTTLIRVRVDVASLSGTRPVSMETLVFRPIW
jgi:type IV pilus assembly protein PilV